MTDKEKGGTQTFTRNDSFNGIANVRPAQSDLKKSFDGAVKLKPAPAPIQQPASQKPSTAPQKSDTNSKK
ncbi:MAG: hypothetical protein ACYDB9_09035 [Gammaproteobacteria bacterium]